MTTDSEPVRTGPHDRLKFEVSMAELESDAACRELHVVYGQLEKAEARHNTAIKNLDRAKSALEAGKEGG